MLPQGDRCVADYAVEFRILVAVSRWNKAALWDAFYSRLEDSMKVELVVRGNGRWGNLLIWPLRWTISSGSIRERGGFSPASCLLGLMLCLSVCSRLSSHSWGGLGSLLPSISADSGRGPVCTAGSQTTWSRPAQFGQKSEAGGAWWVTCPPLVSQTRGFAYRPQ